MKYLKGALAVIVLVLFDQLTKLWALKALTGGSDRIIWNGVFRLHYLENTGAAFGIFQDQQWFSVVLLILTAALLVVLGALYGRIPDTRRFLPLKTGLVLLLAGAAGNLIDRVFRGFVVDFLYFELIHFPVFNIADCYVTISAALLLILFLFRYKDDDLRQLGFSEKKDGSPL